LLSLHTHLPSGDITGDSSERRGAGFLGSPLLGGGCLFGRGTGARLADGGDSPAGGLGIDLPEPLLCLPLLWGLGLLWVLLVVRCGDGLLADIGGGGLPLALVSVLLPALLPVVPPSPPPDVLLALLACCGCGDGDGGAGCDGGEAFWEGGDGEGAAS
jgi:hypothetical protein